MTKITYNGKTTELADGYIATLPCKDLKMETDVVVEAPEESGGVAIAEWNGSIAYNPDAIVIFEKVYYVCIKATTAGSVANNPSVTPTEWKRLNGAYKGEYNSSTTYYLGDIVLSNNNLYQSKIDNPETTPDNDMASRWTLLHEGGSGGEQPQLNAPVISSSGFTVNIEDTNNGNFVDGYKVYVGETLVATITDKSVNMETIADTSKTFSVTVTAYADKFLDSANSNQLSFVVAEGTEGLSYTPIGSTAYACAGLGEATDTNIVIASSYNGLPVTEIVARSFRHNTTIKSVKIPMSVTVMGERAFQNISSLEEVDLGGVLCVPSYAFVADAKLSSITFHEGQTELKDQAFNGCTSLTTIRLPSTITTIDASAFSGCTGITDIYVPWAEGAVANAPWGATSATIHYNSEV